MEQCLAYHDILFIILFFALKRSQLQDELGAKGIRYALR